MRLGLLLWGPVAAYMALLFLASSLSSPPGATVVRDYVLHAAAYTVLGMLMMRALHGGFGRFRWRPALLAVLLTAGYGALDELHQAFVPGRHSSVADLLADTAGALAAVVLTRIWTWIRRD